MKYVRLENNIVREIIPDTAAQGGIARWYGEEFAAQCRKATEDVEQHWVYDPETDTYAPPPETPETPQAEQADMSAAAMSLSGIVFAHLAQSEQLDDVTVTEHADIFPVWDESWTGKAGTILRDEGALYRSIHNVGAGQNTKPSVTPSMWSKIGDPAEEWPVWAQPIGAHDAYNEGDKVSHLTKRWISEANGNVWEPGVHGWSERE